MNSLMIVLPQGLSVSNENKLSLPIADETQLIVRKSYFGEWSDEIVKELAITDADLNKKVDESQQYDEYTILMWPSKKMLRCGVIDGKQSLWREVRYGFHGKCETREEFFDAEQMVENEDVF